MPGYKRGRSGGHSFEKRGLQERGKVWTAPQFEAAVRIVPAEDGERFVAEIVSPHGRLFRRGIPAASPAAALREIKGSLLRSGVRGGPSEQSRPALLAAVNRALESGDAARLVVGIAAAVSAALEEATAQEEAIAAGGGVYPADAAADSLPAAPSLAALSEQLQGALTHLRARRDAYALLPHASIREDIEATQSRVRNLMAQIAAAAQTSGEVPLTAAEASRV